jgi:signal transduction histidine kinase
MLGRDLYRGTRKVLAWLWQDLWRGAATTPPLPPLAVKSPRWRRLPHAAILAAALVLAAVAWSGLEIHNDVVDVSVQDFAAEDLAALHAVLVALPLLVVLVRPVAAWWLSLVLSAGMAEWQQGPMSTWPWSNTGFASHLLVMAVVAAVTRPRVAAVMWLLTTAVSVGFHQTVQPWMGTNAYVMVVASGAVLLAVALLRAWFLSKEADVAQERSYRALLEERTDIARELHDVVAHHMSVVAIQAEAAPYRVQNPPPELTEAFATIRENAVAALADLRRVLGVVRTADFEAPEAPQPTLGALEALLVNVREAGLEVRSAVTGPVRDLPQVVEVSAYRIVQEALSNSLRHAPGAEARVELAYEPGGLLLRIVNGTPRKAARPSPGAGHGIAGMRERVTMLDGDLTAGPTADGGYEVSVFLPAPAGEARA